MSYDLYVVQFWNLRTGALTASWKYEHLSSARYRERQVPPAHRATVLRRVRRHYEVVPPPKKR